MKKFQITIFILLGLVAISAYLAFKSIDHFQVPNLQSEAAKTLVESARDQIGVVTKYSNEYWAADKIPENGGACADVVWRTMKGVNFDLQKAIEEDIVKNINDYPQSPPMDANINFRRVKIVRVYLEKHAQKLPIEIVPYDLESLQRWQGGDIVTFAQLPNGLEHIAVVSDKRRIDGVPLIIHNYGKGVLEDDYLLAWPSAITGHYRLYAE